MKVDVLHGNDLGIATSGRTALDTKDGTEAGLAKGEDDVFTQAVKGIGETDRRGGLAFARRCGIDGGHKDEPALLRTVPERADVHLRLGVAIRLEHVIGKTHLLGDLPNGKHPGFLRDFDIRLESHCPLLVPMVEKDTLSAYTTCRRHRFPNVGMVDKPAGLHASTSHEPTNRREGPRTRHPPVRRSVEYRPGSPPRTIGPW